MYKVKIFSEKTTSTLQQSVNDWLHENKDIVIHNSNLSGSLEFFILYSSAVAQQNELKEIAATAVQDQSIDAKEINPEIMTPSS